MRPRSTKKLAGKFNTERELTLADLGDRLRGERLRRAMSLDELAKRSRVSRSMISAIERGAKAATVLILDRIATGLGSSLARLLTREIGARVILTPRETQPVARDPSGWERRILSPVLPGVEFEFMRTTLGPGVNAGTFLPHAHGSREYVAVEKGTLLLTIDGEPHLLKAGDSIYYDGDCRHAFANPLRSRACVYYLAMDVSGDASGTQHRLAPAETGARIRTQPSATSSALVSSAAPRVRRRKRSSAVDEGTDHE
jgi:XRE family transcriptional regulator, regulator of sulfur utilization